MITLEKVTKRYAGSARASVEDLDLDIMQGEFLCLLGPSGCGKSTTLRMIAGLEALSAGRISIDGTVVDDVASGRHVDAERRGLGFVFQNYALWPHLTVAENVAFGPRVQRVRKAERRERVGRALDALGITALADRIPSALSGGQQQRVAIARTLAARPSAMLLDEPLSNLDAKLRLEMRGEFQRVHRESGATMVFVTHDQFEAMTLATRIVVMNAGAIQQIGTPAEIYDRPVEPSDHDRAPCGRRVLGARPRPLAGSAQLACRDRGHPSRGDAALGGASADVRRLLVRRDGVRGAPDRRILDHRAARRSPADVLDEHPPPRRRTGRTGDVPRQRRRSPSLR